MEKHYILLHGALGAADQLEPIAQALKAKGKVSAHNFSGHGGTSIPAAGYRIQDFAEELETLVQPGFENIIFGYSMGGYVAAYLLSEKPSLPVTKIVTLGTKWKWDPEIAAREVKMLDPGVLAEKVPAFAQSLAARHEPEDWKAVMKATAEMMLAMGANPPLTASAFQKIKTPVTLLRAENDKMVSAEETQETHEHITNSTSFIIPGQHPVETVKTDDIIHYIY